MPRRRERVRLESGLKFDLNRLYARWPSESRGIEFAARPSGPAFHLASPSRWR